MRDWLAAVGSVFLFLVAASVVFTFPATVWFFTGSVWLTGIAGLVACSLFVGTISYIANR